MDMPTESNELLSTLIARLPELEWKISELGTFFSSQNLPKGLFRFDTTQGGGAVCIAEIKADIQLLSEQKNKQSAYYLADRIRQKVNVLVLLCKIHHQKNKPEKNVYFGVKMLSTRQQCISELEAKITVLAEQQLAMIKTLNNLKNNHHSNAILHLKAELGEVEQRLTLAKEALTRVVS